MKIRKKLYFFIIIIILVVLSLIILTYLKKSNTDIKEMNNEISISKDELDLEMKRESILGEDKLEKEKIQDTKKEIFERKFIEKECEKRDIKINSKQEEEFRNKAFKEELSKEDKEYAKKSGMSEEEMRQAIYDLSIEMQKKVELYDVLLKEIYNNKVTINDENFKNKVNKYNEKRNSDKGSLNYNLKELNNLADEYFALIEKQYTMID